MEQAGDTMAQSLLTAFWIVPPSRHGPLGFGVTGWSLEDALRIIRVLGYERYLPEDLSTLAVREGVTVAELDHSYVVGHMGPFVVRGMWYPFVAIGIPEWASI
jgi:hypothetical protein